MVDSILELSGNVVVQVEVCSLHCRRLRDVQRAVDVVVALRHLGSLELLGRGLVGPVVLHLLLLHHSLLVERMDLDGLAVDDYVHVVIEGGP